MIRVSQNSIGLLFFIKDQFLKYSFKDKNILKGSKKDLEEKLVSNINILEQDLLWITNIEKIPDFFPLNIKNYNFFNISFKSIIQYHNIESAPTKVQFDKLINFYQKQISYFKEEYPNLSLNIEKLKKYNNFADAFERSEIKTSINIDFPWDYHEDFDLELNYTKEQTETNSLNGYFSYSRILEIISELSFPTGGLEIYDIDKKRIDRDNFSKISQKKDFAIIGKLVKSIEYDNPLINENIFLEKDIEEDRIITDFEAEYLLTVFDIIPTKFIFFNESNSLKELIRLPFRLKKYNSFSYDIFCKTILLSILNNNISILNFWIKRFERLYKLDKLITLYENDINIIKGNNFDFQLNIAQKESDENKLKSKTPFEIKQNKKDSDVLLLESHNFCYLYKDYIQMKKTMKKEEK